MFLPRVFSTKLLYVVLLIAICISVSAAQSVEVLNAQAQINRVLEESGKHFKSGLEDLRFNRRQDSGDKFDKSVETFLLSTLNIQRDPKLQACYSQLVETIYRMEHPVDNQAPQLRPLAATCGWNWNEADGKLADEVATLLKPTKRPATADAKTIASIFPGNQQNVQELQGFNNQVFESSPLDELSKLELTADELDICDSSPPTNRRIVKAQAGDTVSKLAIRNGADPTEVARYNGLLPNSVLSAGREIKIPTSGSPSNSSYSTYSRPSSTMSDRDCKVDFFPHIQQLKLGMSAKDVDNTLKRRSIHKKGLYAGYTLVSHQGLKGLRALILRFYNSTLYDITVYYDNSIRWNGMPEFERTVAKALGLQNSWQSSSYCTVGSNCRLFSCTNTPFKLTLGQSGGFYSLNIWDTKVFLAMVTADGNKRLAEERKKHLEQQRKKNEFKP